MSKKKKKTPARKVVRKAKPGKATARTSAAAAPARFTASATIFVYEVGGQTRVRTSPQVLGAGPGSIEWTVVNLTSDTQPDVDITWRDESPWGGKAPIAIRGGNYRCSLDGARNGRYKYNVTCGGYTEDPEVEIPGN